MNKLVKEEDWGECCNYCTYMKSICNKDYCIRFPPVKKNKFPVVDPYYTRCGEFKHKVKAKVNKMVTIKMLKDEIKEIKEHLQKLERYFEEL